MKRMMTPLPGQREIIYEENGIIYSHNLDKKVKTIDFKGNKLDKTEFISFIEKNKDEYLKLYSIRTGKDLNKIVYILNNIDYKGKVYIDCSTYKSLVTVKKDTKIDIESIPDNVKLSLFSKTCLYNISTWCHNLSEKDTISLFKVLDDQSKELFKKQKEIISDFTKRVLKDIPNILELDEKERMDILFDYVAEKIPYAYECLAEGGMRTKPGCDWSHEPIETYYRGRGICEGRANLFTFLVNNPIFKVNCTIVEGKHPNGANHVWNVFQDKNNKLHFYDLSHALSIKYLTEDELTNHGYIIERYYLSRPEKEIDNDNRRSKKRVVTPLPERNPNGKVISPLPKRRKNILTPLPTRRTEND